MTLTPRARIRNKNHKAFTLLELVVALVVLGILAALAVPTYLTVIGNAKSAVATSDALSVATDAVAIASGSDSVAVESNFYTAANVESSNVALASSPDYTTGGGASSITLAVTLGSGVYDVVVTWPDSVNAAPYVTSVSGGSDSTTTTSTTTTTVPPTTTTTAPPVIVDGSSVAGEPDCTSTVTGPIVSYVPASWSLTCSGVTGDSVRVTVPIPGGDFEVTVSSADSLYSLTGAPYTALPSSFTTDSTSVYPPDDSTPSAPANTSAFSVPSGFYSGPDRQTAQGFTSGGYDSCWSFGTSCGDPTSVEYGF
jgi:prepilin-type N-terminal cleavage/methylation domain-containing protein